ncbi:hypothetical protein BE20_22850 [Sorangium cellulosum]|nr:hypothetical protein BE20_22850 [Sorangium cellulosum]
MYGGSDCAACRRSSSASGAGSPLAVKYATRRLSPGSSSRATTTTSRTPGARDRHASISPSSTRKPRILTWKSLRPRYSTLPSGSRRARSPVRYSRPPPGNGFSRKRSAVSSGWPR